MRLRAWAASDVGRKRDHNEDSHLSDERLGLFAVADGMGGHQGGDHASRMAIEVLRDEIDSHDDFDAAAQDLMRTDPVGAFGHEGRSSVSSLPPLFPPRPGASRIGARVKGLISWSAGNGDLGADDRPFDDVGDMPTDPTLLPPPPAASILRAAARAAGRAIYDAAQVDAALAGMGTTLTAALFHKDRAHFVHVGDSRAMLVRDGQVTQLTDDHSWIAEQVRAGVLTENEARESKFRHIITRSVGFEREVDVDLFGVPVLPGDCFVLCSDGMSNYFNAEELGRIVSMTYYAKIPQLLVDLANDRGGDDNITVVIVYAANEQAS
jgi:serine/threonine protein phosphatase PrpC